MPSPSSDDPVPRAPKPVAMIRAIQQHDPTLEPWASMTRAQLEALMETAEDGVGPGQWGFLELFVADKLPPRERETRYHAYALAAFLVKEYGVQDYDRAVRLTELAAEIARIIAERLPARG